MDECIGKRASSGVGISKRGSSLTSRHLNEEERSIPYCNRLGCSTRLYAMQNSEICTDSRRSKCSRPFLRSSSNKWMYGSSSKQSSGTSYLRKTQNEQKLSTFQKETISTSQKVAVTIESGDIKEQAMISEPRSSVSAVATYEMRRSSASLNSGYKKKNHQHSSSTNQNVQSRQRSSLTNQSVHLGTSVSSTRSTESSGHTAKSTLQGFNHRKGREVAKQQALPNGERGEVAKQQALPNGESSSTSSNSASRLSNRNRRNGGQNTNFCSPGRSANQQPLRRTRPSSAGRNSMASVRTSGKVTTDCASDSNLIISELNLHSQQSEVLISELDMPSPSWSSSTELPSISEGSNTTDQSEGPGSRSLQSRSVGHRLEDGVTRSSHRMSYDRDGFRQFQMEGIAEVLFAFDRIRHDEELTYQQLLALETNLFLGGSNFHDQHRDMRLDIDNMSYEELLALEEKMGTVSTALTEEQLLNCLKRSIYTSAAFVSGDALIVQADVNCSICQEEYVAGDEVGELVCRHRYHMVCIHQWLRLKNWCPICKVPLSQS